MQGEDERSRRRRRTEGRSEGRRDEGGGFILDLRGGGGRVGSWRRRVRGGGMREGKRKVMEYV